MVNKQSIINFFDNEAEASRENWERLMAFPLKERIRKRKAIDGLQLVEGSKRVSEENEILIQFSYTRNLSDFKEGDYLFLHEEGTQSGMQCSLYEYSEENTLTISVFQPNLIYTDEYLKSKTWLLDRAYVDLRKHVFANFFCGLSNDSDYWEKCLVNNPTTPELCDVSSADEELDDTIANFGFSFTEKQREAIINAMATNDYYLIQGPPGTGKSFVLGVIILEEVLFFNHKVMVIGPNHMAINNAIGQLLKITPNACNYVLKVGQANNASTIKVEKSENGEVGITNYHHLNVPLFNQTIEKAKMGVVVGLTPHSLYTSRAQGLECDTLVVDEAGQMTIPLGLMGMIKAKKVIFAGDHRQLPPIVTSDKISEDMKQSIFQKLMRDDNCTMLDTTFRMCVPICDFVSALFYEGKLKSLYKSNGTGIYCSDKLLSYDAPIVMLNVEDEGLQVSEKEAEAIVEIVVKYISQGIDSSQIGVLSPFRAQAAHIRRMLKNDERLSEDTAKGIAVDTIDKMQGQEREVIIFTMVAGNLEYMLEMAEFLYNPNKLNVAFSRAKAKLIIVGNMAKLTMIDAVTFPHIKQMLEYNAERIDWQ